MKKFTYLQARVLLLLLGAGLALGQTVVAWERGAAPTEVLAPALSILVFVGAIFWYIAGGLVGAALASLLYGALLADQAESVGLRVFAGLLVSRVAQYVFYAIVLAAGTRFIETRLHKLELYDQIDDDTELYNASFFLQDSDLETSRSNRYRTIFSVSELTIERVAFAGHKRRRYIKVLRDVAGRIQQAGRTVDRPVRVDETSRDRFLIILPETGREGAQIFTGRLEVQIRDFLAERDCAVDGNVASRAFTYPDDQATLAEVREEVARIEQARKAIREE